jgi:hypothetical protein
MPESNLAVNYTELRMRIADHRGYGLDADLWNEEQTQMIDFCLMDGSRTFYTQSGYEWSFLSPVVSMAIAEGDTEIEMPSDFGFLTDDLYFDDDWGNKIVRRNAGEVLMQRQQDSTSTGRPVMVAEMPGDGPGINRGQRTKLIFWPIAGQAYTLQVPYTIIPNGITAQNPFPYGGAAHAQTMIESCLAASERLYGVPGLHNQLYAMALETSKQHDRRLKPRTMGYNGNRTRKSRWQPRNQVPVVYTDL